MDPILGQIILWPIPWVPDGWALCDGTLINVNQNQALYSLLGNMYGGSPGVSFGVPDLRNRVPLGTQYMTNPGVTVGATTSSTTAIGAGAATITLNNLPGHSHTAVFTPTGGGGGTYQPPTVGVTIGVANNSTGNVSDPTGNIIAVPKPSGAGSITAFQASGSATGTLGGVNVTVSGGSGGGGITGGTIAVGNTGNGQPLAMQVAVPVTLSTIQPCMTMNFIIATSGVYPSRP